MEIKDRIQQKAEELFKTYGIRSITMDEIAAQLGISKKTIYQFYSDKEEIVSAVFFSAIEQNKSCCLKDRANAKDPIEEVIMAFELSRDMFKQLNPSVLFDLQKYHPGIYTKFIEYKNGFLYQVIKTNLENGIKQGLYRTDINLEIITRYRLESATLPFNQHVFPDNANKLAEIGEELTFHFLYGIVTPKGYTKIEAYKKNRQNNSNAK